MEKIPDIMANKPRSFRPAHLAPLSERRRQYDRDRGSARERGYSARWDREAGAYKRAFPLCVGCLAVGRYRAVRVVDHIEPHKGDDALFWDQDNWQSSCAWHHDVVKQRLEDMWKRGEIDKASLNLNSRAAIDLTMSLDP